MSNFLDTPKEYRLTAFHFAYCEAIVDLLVDKGIVGREEVLERVAKNEGLTVDKLKELMDEAIEASKKDKK